MHQIKRCEKYNLVDPGRPGLDEQVEGGGDKGEADVLHNLGLVRGHGDGALLEINLKHKNLKFQDQAQQFLFPPFSKIKSRWSYIKKFPKFKSVKVDSRALVEPSRMWCSPWHCWCKMCIFCSQLAAQRRRAWSQAFLDWWTSSQSVQGFPWYPAFLHHSINVRIDFTFFIVFLLFAQYGPLPFWPRVPEMGKLIK